MAFILAVLAFLAAVSGCSKIEEIQRSQEPEGSADQTVYSEDTERSLATAVKRPDILALSIRDQDSRLLDSEEAMVMADGTIQFASVGKLKVDGKELSEVQALVQGELGNQVTVEVRILAHGAQ